MYYLQIGNRGLVVILPNDELIITSDREKATKYKTAGEAMKAAIKVNSALGTHAVKFAFIHE